jgi:SOS-response transcriptional repressor LexA
MKMMSDIFQYAVGTVDLIMVEAIGAGSTPLSECRIIGKRRVKRIKGATKYDRYICAPISGYSLKDDDILDGDFVILKLNFDRWDVKEGQLVAVKCPAGNVVKHYHRIEGGMIRLASANRDYEDLYFDAEDVQVQAIVVRSERVKEWS